MNTKTKLIDKQIFNSRIKSQDTTNSERILGYLIGPVGALLFNTIVNGYINLYYTDVLKLTAVAGGAFLAIFPIVSKVIDAITNMLMGYVIDHTRTKQGKARPYILLGAILMPLAGIAMYAVPKAGQTAQLVWIVLSYNLYYAISYTIYNISHNMMIPLSTRNSEQRSALSTFASISNIVIAGTLAAVLVPMLILPAIGVDQSKWITMVCIVSIIVIPLTLFEYYFTRERVTEEAEATGNNDVVEIPYSTQMKACFTDKYMMLVLIIFVITQFVTIIRNTSLLYYCNYILGSYNDGISPTILQVVGGLPMGIGMFVIIPLTKKFEKRHIFLVGCALIVIGGLVCLINPTSWPIVITGQIIKNIGSIPGSYIFMALFADCLDAFEIKHKFRCDGFAMSLYSIILTIATGVCTSIFNLILSGTGYVAPELVDGVTVAATQSEATLHGILWSYYGLEIIGMIVVLVLYYFLKAEKFIKASGELENA